MAYAVKYLFKFQSSNGTVREIRVLQDGYSGAVIQRPLGRAPVIKKEQNGGVHGTSLTFYAECHVDREFIEFYTSDPKEYRVDVYAGSTLLWQGYITPELYSEPDIAPPYDVEVVATDGVGELKLYDFAPQGTVTLRSLLSYLLGYTGLSTDVNLVSSLKPGSHGAGALLDMQICVDYLAGKTCYEALTYLLDTLNATITRWGGAWLLVRETNVTFTNDKVRYFNTAGNSALLSGSVQTLGSMRSAPAWPVGQLSMVIDPAKNKVAVQAPWHPVTCLANADMASDTAWAKANNASYGPDGYLFPNNDTGGSSYATAHISQSIASAGLRVPMSFELKATGVAAQVGARVGAVIGVLITYTVGNTVYLLRRGDEGTPVWKEGSAPGSSIDGSLVDYQQPLASFDADRIQAETLSIDEIPAFVQGTSYPSGTLTVYVIGTCARAYSAHLDVVLPKGYQDVLRIDNGARGEGDTVEIAIGRETAEVAYYAAFLQGLLLDNGALITSFSDANFEGMNYLALIARDYALSVALPRASVKGNVYLESSIGVPPLVFAKGGLNYWIETWSWDLYEDELEISARTLPSASLTVQSETILESDGSTVSSASTAGSSGGGGGSFPGGVNYFELDDTLVRLKGQYDYLGPRKGLIFEGVSESDADLYVKKITVGSSTQRVLYSPLPLITEGDQIVGSGTPGGGGGGGATYMRDLEDVSLTNLSNGQMLAWDASLRSGQGAWKNVPAPTGTITSVALASGTNNGTLMLTVNGVATDNIAVTGWSSKADASALGNYVAKAGDSMTGSLSVPNLNITSLSGSDEITFARGNYSYVRCITSGGKLGFITDGKSMAAASVDLAIGPGWVSVNNGVNGASSYNLYVNGSAYATSLTASILYAGRLMTNGSSSDAGIWRGSLISSSLGAGSIAIASDTVNDHIVFLRGNVGIGTVSPAYKLDVAGSLNATTIYQNGIALGSNAFSSTAYLPLAGGTMTGTITWPASNSTVLQGLGGTVGGTGMIFYSLPNSGQVNMTVGMAPASGYTTSYLYLRTSAGLDLYHTKGSTNYTIWDSGNSNKSDVAWTAAYISLNSTTSYYPHIRGNGSFITMSPTGSVAAATDDAVYLGAHKLAPFAVCSGQIDLGGGSGNAWANLYLANNKIIYFEDSGGTSRNIMWVSSSNDFIIGRGLASCNTGNKRVLIEGDSVVLRYGASGVNGFTLNNSGNVTIDASDLASTYYKLYVGGRVNINSTAASALRLYVSSASTSCYTDYYANNSSEHYWRTGHNTSGYYIISYDGTGNNLIVNSSGAVGIGTSSPAYTLDVNGTIGTNNNIFLFESLKFTRPNYCYVSATGSGSALSFNIGESGSTNSKMLICNSGNVSIGYFGDVGSKLYVAGSFRVDMPGAADFIIKRTYSGGGAYITYYADNQTTNYWLAGADPSASYNSQFAFLWNATRVVAISTAGVLTTTGDQVISSDATLKTNLQDVTYSVKDIAGTRAVTFDWKDGRGKSAGSIAQDWKPLIPELVHGEEGSMTLAYGQIALVNTIIEAREIEVLKKRVAELEDEVKRLRS